MTDQRRVGNRPDNKPFLRPTSNTVRSLSAMDAGASGPFAGGRRCRRAASARSHGNSSELRQRGDSEGRA